MQRNRMVCLMPRAGPETSMRHVAVRRAECRDRFFVEDRRKASIIFQNLLALAKRAFDRSLAFS